MPNYEFRCQDCKKSFAKSMTFSEYDKKKVKCPHCNSKKVSQSLSEVLVKTSRKS